MEVKQVGGRMKQLLCMRLRGSADIEGHTTQRFGCDVARDDGGWVDGVSVMVMF